MAVSIGDTWKTVVTKRKTSFTRASVGKLNNDQQVQDTGETLSSKLSRTMEEKAEQGKSI